MALATDYNILVLGTGITESVVSSALSRVHKKILHLDANNYYADIWASKTLTDFVLWLSRTTAPNQNPAEPIVQSDGSVVWGVQREDQSVLMQDWFWAPRLRLEMETNHDNLLMTQEPIKPDIRGDRPSLISLHQLVNQNRRFNVDITPKLIFSKSKIMDALTRTGLGFYSDFQKVSKSMHVKQNGRIIQLPHDLVSIGNSSKISEEEKQHVTNFLQWVKALELSDNKKIEPLQGKTLKDVLDEKNIKSNFAKITLIETFALSHNTVGAVEGIALLKNYLNSLTEEPGSPLSWIHYGSMELAEAFCRHAAVWGTTFILRRTIDTVTVVKNRVTSVLLTSSHTINVENLIMNARYAPLEWLDVAEIKYIARAIFFTDAPLRATNQSADIESSPGNGVSILLFHMDGYSQPVRIIELPTTVRACPPNTWLVHMTLTLTHKGPSPPPLTTPRDIFQPIARVMFTEDEDNMGKPHALLSAFFITRSYTDAIKNRSASLPENVYLTPGPDTYIDYDSNVLAASDIFETICTTEKFLPATPVNSADQHTSEHSRSISNERLV